MVAPGSLKLTLQRLAADLAPEDWLRFLFFAACLVPINIGVYSVNYLFVLYPVWCVLAGRPFCLPPPFMLAALGWFTLIFVCGVLLDVSGGAGIDLRSLISFAIFSSIFALTFLSLTGREIAAFKFAVILVAVSFALISVFGFFSAGGNAAGFAQKDIVGSQRYGFVYLSAFFFIMSKRSDLGVPLPLRSTIVTILLAGMLLTFSRSTVVTFVAAIAVYLLLTAFESRRTPRAGLGDVTGRAAMVISSLVILVIIMPLPFNFFTHQILLRYIPVLEYVVEPVEGIATGLEPDDERLAIVEDVFNEAGSEGTRLVLWKLIFEHVNQHPVLGAHYKGIWTLEGAPSGSAHNQLLDVLLRTGWPGLIVYVVLLVQLLVCFYRADRSLFWALLGILIFGSFHETFKESQGAFILAFFMGIMAAYKRHALGEPRPALNRQSTVDPTSEPPLTSTQNADVK